MKMLYGVGAGPGDPELLTLRAVRCLCEAQHIFVPRTLPDEPGLAETIVQEYLAGKHVISCHFPMGADNTERYVQTAKTIEAAILDGETGAFVTLGDPLVYSTYAYTMREAQKLGVEVRIVPGITSFTAAAAALAMPITVKNESVYLTDGQVEEDILARVHTACILKVRRHKADTLEKLEKHGFHYTYIRHCSLPQETILHDKEAILQDREYMSLLLARKVEE